ncbi:MAG: hypothetical protein IPP06_18760 [Saprospiraceae bacterium]|nr:hypothetical protein [Candidatus Vicinibacter affinis]
MLGLLAHRKAGRWESTQENVFVLAALDRYFHEYEKVTPDFVAKIWLGDGYAGDHAFKGRQTDRFQIDIPMKTVADKAAKGPADLVIQKDGAGRLYYRVGMTYAPANLQLAAADYGFTVVRKYEAVDAPGDVTHNADGSWTIKAGSRVRVRLAMVAENRRYHVALVDPLPAGLEPMNPALAVTGPVPQDPKPAAGADRYWWWWSTWYEHQNLRDERVEAFTSLLWEGVYDYTYVARATTPGTFVVPPTKADSGPLRVGATPHGYATGRVRRRRRVTRSASRDQRRAISAPPGPASAAGRSATGGVGRSAASVPRVGGGPGGTCAGAAAVGATGRGVTSTFTRRFLRRISSSCSGAIAASAGVPGSGSSTSVVAEPRPAVRAIAAAGTPCATR